MKCISEQAQEQDSTTVPFNTDQKLIVFILLLNSDVFYKSKSGTHGEPDSLKPARKEVNYISLCHPPSLGSSGLLTSWWAGMPTASPLGFCWGKRALESWEGERKRSMEASSLQTSPLPLPSSLIPWSSPPFCYYSSWQAFCVQNLLTKSVYQRYNRTPGGETLPVIQVFQLEHLSDFSLNSNLAINMFHLSLMKRSCILNTHFATGYRQELWWYKLHKQPTILIPYREDPGHICSESILER